MPKKVNPYRSKDAAVYHVYADCPLGSKIPQKNKVAGQGGKKLCSFCKKLASPPKPKPVAKPKVKAKVKPKAKPIVKAKAKTKVKPKAKPVAKPKVKAKAKPKAKGKKKSLLTR